MYLTTRRSNFIDDMFSTTTYRSGRPAYTTRQMKTNIQETEDGYILEMELPGYKKEDLQAELKDGYLTVTAEKSISNEETDKEVKYIRRERFEGSCKRSFYVGEYLKQEDIKASYNDGILKLTFPNEQQASPKLSQMINIE